MRTATAKTVVFLLSFWYDNPYPFVIPDLIRNPVMEKIYCIYILSSQKNGTLYIGVTSDLIKRVYEHKNKLADGFTKKYNVDKLVYFESTTDVYSAISREKQLKNWKREWKLKLIEKINPNWNDLYNDLISGS